MPTKKRKKKVKKPVDLLPEPEDLLPEPVPLLPPTPPKMKDRVIGTGRKCARCGGHNTKIANTHSHPHFVQWRRRYHVCMDCSYRFRTEGERS